LFASGALGVDGEGPPEGDVWACTVADAASRPAASNAILMVLMTFLT
jgi:hypothetical protein